jgi:hypothetical protein
MEKVIKFLEELIEEMNDTSWRMGTITDYKEITKDDDTYAELPNGSIYEKQDDWYITQTHHGEDWYSGTIIYPITESKAVIIYYDC